MRTPRWVADSPHLSVVLNVLSHKVPTLSTQVSPERALNKLEWDRKDGRRAAIGASDGRLHIYDIGDAAVPRESEWTDLQKTLAGLLGGGASVGLPSAVAEPEVRSASAMGDARR
jgi:hypothetical protein